MEVSQSKKQKFIISYFAISAAPIINGTIQFSISISFNIDWTISSTLGKTKKVVSRVVSEESRAAKPKISCGLPNLIKNQDI